MSRLNKTPRTYKYIVCVNFYHVRVTTLRQTGKVKRFRQNARRNCSRRGRQFSCSKTLFLKNNVLFSNNHGYRKIVKGGRWGKTVPTCSPPRTDALGFRCRICVEAYAYKNIKCNWLKLKTPLVAAG